MAKVGGASSFGSQFFISLVDNRGLDFDNGLVDKFYPFGEVISGMDVVRELTQGVLGRRRNSATGSTT